MTLPSVSESPGGTRLVIQLLGGLVVKGADGAPVQVRRVASQWVLVRCLLDSEPVARDVVAFELWPDVPTATALGNLRQALYWLQHDLASETGGAPFIQPQGRSALRRNDDIDYWLDLDAFSGRMTAAETAAANGHDTAILTALQSARALSNGPLVPDIVHPWIVPARQAIERERVRCRELLGERLEQRGEPEEALAVAFELDRFAVPSEARDQQLVRLLGQLNRHDEARALLSERSARLEANGLRLTPGHGVWAVTRPVGQGEGMAAVGDGQGTGLMYRPGSAASEAASAPIHPAGLAQPLDAPWPFLGRDALVLAIRAQVRPRTVVTLVGAPGVGTSRLTAEVAQAVGGDFAAGVRRTALRPADDRVTAIARIGRDWGCLSDSALDASTVEHLQLDHSRDLDALWVIDGADGQLEVAAEVAAALTSRNGNGSVIVASREALEIDGERIVLVPPLSAAHSLALFLAIAPSTSSDFAAAISNAFDGLPLGLVIAGLAANVDGPDSVLERLGSRPDLVTAPAPLVDTRRRNLATAIASSWARLSGDERRVLATLAACERGQPVDEAIMFVRERTRDAHERLDVRSLLYGLAARSLVASYRSPTTAQTTYRVLRPIASYALAHASEG